jgi:hypothetical protein
MKRFITGKVNGGVLSSQWRCGIEEGVKDEDVRYIFNLGLG